MKKVIRLTESDLMRIVKRIMNESKKFGSFDDEEWYDEDDKFTRVDDMGDDFDDEEFDDFDSFSSKHGHDTKWFGKGDSGRKMFDTYKDKHSKPFKVRTRRGMDEQSIGSHGPAVTDVSLLSNACGAYKRLSSSDKQKFGEWTKTITRTQYPYSMETACTGSAKDAITTDNDRKILKTLTQGTWKR